MSKQTRKSYPVSMFAVTRTQIAQWRKKEEQLKKSNMRNRRVGSGNKPAYPLAENALKEWIVSQPNAAQEFKASDKWFNGLQDDTNSPYRNRPEITLRHTAESY